MRFSSQGKQLSIDAFRSSLADLPKSNRWVRLGDSLPWDEIERLYNHRLDNGKRGAGNKPARMIEALLVKHKMNLSNEETILAIQENPYMQYFVGLSEFTDNPIFDPTLFVTIRKRLGSTDFNDMSISLLKIKAKVNISKLKSLEVTQDFLICYSFLRIWLTVWGVNPKYILLEIYSLHLRNY